MIEPNLLERIEKKKKELDGLRPLPAAQLQRLREQIDVEWIYNSNAIEGSTLSLRETQLILETGITIGGKSLREHFEVINHRDAIRYMETLVSSNTHLSAFHVRQMHKLVLTKIDDKNAGQYRKTQVRIAGAAHVPPESWEIPGLMSNWEQEIAAADDERNVIDAAASAHHRLVAVHPFIDGNGRTARLVMNLLLMRKGYPPAVIMKLNRRQYYTALAKADKGNNTLLVNMVAMAVERSLTMYLDALSTREKPPTQENRWIPLREAATGISYSQEYLSLLARKGRLEAVKRGGVWHTTKRAIDDYIKSLK